MNRDRPRPATECLSISAKLCSGREAVQAARRDVFGLDVDQIEADRSKIDEKAGFLSIVFESARYAVNSSGWHLASTEILS